VWRARGGDVPTDKVEASERPLFWDALNIGEERPSAEALQLSSSIKTSTWLSKIILSSSSTSSLA
jgi:hypothetical protein